MTPNQQQLLEDILVAQVLLLSRHLAQEAKSSGTTRIGGDYTTEAIQQIKAQRGAILQRLLQP